jgi:hypothetical protein
MSMPVHLQQDITLRGVSIATAARAFIAIYSTVQLYVHCYATVSCALQALVRVLNSRMVICKYVFPYHHCNRHLYLLCYTTERACI